MVVVVALHIYHFLKYFAYRVYINVTHMCQIIQMTKQV